MKQRTQRFDADSIISMCRPQKRFRSQFYMMLAFGEAETNAEKGLVGRLLDAHKGLHRDLHFLAGFLSLLPALKLKRETQRLHEGRTILENSYSLLDSIPNPPTLSYVKRIRLQRERMLRFVEKIEKDIKAN